jgi:uncharacterized membrane protein
MTALFLYTRFVDWLVNTFFWLLGFGVFGLVWFCLAYLIRIFVLYIKKQDEDVLDKVAAFIALIFGFMLANYFEDLYQFFWDR